MAQFQSSIHAVIVAPLHHYEDKKKHRIKEWVFVKQPQSQATYQITTNPSGMKKKKLWYHCSVIKSAAGGILQLDDMLDLATGHCYLLPVSYWQLMSVYLWPHLFPNFTQDDSSLNPNMISPYTSHVWALLHQNSLRHVFTFCKARTNCVCHLIYRTFSVMEQP